MIVGVVGKARSGKDTVARFLGKYGFERMSFADPLKEVVAAKFGIPLVNCYGMTDTGEEFDREAIHPFWGISVRQMLQIEGTEATRNIYDREFWTKRMDVRISRSNAKRIVIPDVRFENEVDFITSRGGVVVGVMRPEVESVADHESEQLADRMTDFCEYVLSNGKDLAHLEQQVEGLAIEFLRTGKVSR
jgi:hypothetical protein